MPMTRVSDFLMFWKTHFDNDVPKSRVSRLWVAMHGTNAKWGILTGVAVFTLSTLDGVMARSSFLDAGPTLRFVSGIYSCTWAVYIFAFKQAQMLRALDQLLKVSLAVDSDEVYYGALKQETRDFLQRKMRSAERYLRGMHFWTGFIFVTVIIPALVTGEPANPSWPKPYNPAGRWSLFGLHFLSTIFLPVGFFTLIPLIRGVALCVSSLMLAVGELIRRARDEEELRRAAALSAELNEGMRLINEVLSIALLHLLQSSLMMPLVASWEVMNGQIDPFLFATGPLNVVIFIPICFAGQSVENASTDMPEFAYEGRWLEENRTCRTIRMQVMQRACRPTRLFSRDLGGINLALCQGSLKNWFSFLNFLINTMK